MRDRISALDGLRTVACLAVVAQHAHVPGAESGWLGVDAFFVLSGYVITRALLDERDRSGAIDLVGFYLRRAARLYPALVITVALALLLPTKTTVVHAAWALTYLSDVAASLHAGLGDLYHTWSLAVEEHFYLVWPAVLLLCARTRRAVALWAASGVVASLGLLLAFCAWRGGMGGGVGYVSTPTRAWAIFVGCLIAVAPPMWARGRASRWGLGFVIPAVTFVAVGVRGHVHPGSSAVLSIIVTITTAGFIITSRHGHSVLTVWPLPQLGAFTYGLYLYHCALLAPLTGGWVTRLAVAIGVGLPIAALSHHWIEAPIKRWARARTAPADATIKLPNVEATTSSTCVI